MIRNNHLYSDQIASIPAVVVLIFMQIQSLYEIETRQNQLLLIIEEKLTRHCQDLNAGH